jgi:deoxyribonuclease-4
MIIGAHVSIAGGVENSIAQARQLGCETFQIFTKNQNQWREKEYTPEQIDTFRKDLSKSKIQAGLLAAHDSYLINLCSPQQDLLDKSRQALLNEARRCAALGIRYLIFHPGAHMGGGEEWGIKKIAGSINFVLQELKTKQVILLLETTAGQGSNLGYRFEQLRQIMDSVEQSDQIGICVDTCHIFAAGYDIRKEQGYEQTCGQLEAVLDLNKVMAFHLNDCKNDCGSRVDRHERIGAGRIGAQAFRLFMQDSRWQKLPGFLEIPGGAEAFKQDIKKLKRLHKK